jgi:hypothetical protein
MLDTSTITARTAARLRVDADNADVVAAVASAVFYVSTWFGADLAPPPAPPGVLYVDHVAPDHTRVYAVTISGEPTPVTFQMATTPGPGGEVITIDQIPGNQNVWAQFSDDGSYVRTELAGGGVVHGDTMKQWIRQDAHVTVRRAENRGLALLEVTPGDPPPPAVVRPDPLTETGLVLLAVRIFNDTGVPSGALDAYGDPTLSGAVIPEQLERHLVDYFTHLTTEWGTA